LQKLWLTAEIEGDSREKRADTAANEAELVAVRGKPMPQCHRTFRNNL